MTKKGYMPKLLAMLIGAIMCLCMATVAFTAAGVVGAKAEGEDIPPMIIEEIDEFATVGYKIEAESGKWTDEATTTEYTYDYKLTLAMGNYIVRNTGSSKFLVNNAEPLVFNVTTSTGYNVTATELVSSSGWTTFSTNNTIGKLVAQKRKSPAIGVEMSGNEGTAYVEASINKDDDEGVLVSGKIRLLLVCVEIQNNEFTFTGAKKDVNGKEGGIWFTFGATDVLGVGSADSEWTRAERDDFIGVNKPFFENIYFLQEFNLENATAAPTAAELAGKDLFSLMTGVNLKENGWLFQTEVRPDHIEIYKQVREYYTDENTFDREGKDVAFEEGDTFYLKAGLKMIGHDANGNWTVASEGGAQNVLSRDQFFTFDGEKWSIDQFSTAISLDKKEAMIEVGANDTITATVEKGKFVSGEASTPVWSSDDETVATVAGGVVTGVAAGTATIKAELADGTYATAEVTVVRNDEIKSITLDKRNITLYTGDENNTYTLVATIEGGSQASKAVTWTSANPAVATVDENGKVTAVAEGSTKVTATAADGKTAEVTVNVLQAEEENPPTPTPGPDDNTDNKGDETKDEGGCGSNVLGTSAIAASVLMLGAAVVLFARKKNAANK